MSFSQYSSIFSLSCRREVLNCDCGAVLRLCNFLSSLYRVICKVRRTKKVVGQELTDFAHLASHPEH